MRSRLDLIINPAKKIEPIRDSISILIKISRIRIPIEILLHNYKTVVYLLKKRNTRSFTY